MHSRSGNMEIMINYKVNEVIEEIFKSLLIDIRLDWKE